MEVTVALPEPARAPCQAGLPGPPAGIQTSEPGEFQVRVTGVFAGALMGVAVKVVTGGMLTWIVEWITCEPLPQVTV